MGVQNLMSLDDIALLQRAASQDSEVALQKKGSDSDSGNTTEETTGGKGADAEEAIGGKGGGSNATTTPADAQPEPEPTTVPTTAAPTTVSPFPDLSICPGGIADGKCSIVDHQHTGACYAANDVAHEHTQCLTVQNMGICCYGMHGISLHDCCPGEHCACTTVL